MPFRKHHPLLKIMNNALIDMPTTMNLSNLWSFGSMTGLCLIIQIITGLILAMQYSPHVELAFSSIMYIMRDVNNGWLIRSLHANTASMFFICMYIHMGRGLYYGSYMFHEVWQIGIILLLLTMAAAFMGYVLVWGQMSFWGATVITNLFSAIPYLGPSFVKWMWGGYSVNNATLNRFFALHFFIPFIIALFAIIHLMFLHSTGSSNPLGINGNSNKLPFHWFFSSKDLMGFILMFLILSIIILSMPNLLVDPENYLPANPLVTPIHIKPEWYFLWAYAILRSVPNKLGGVLAMFMAIMMLSIMSLCYKSKRKGLTLYPTAQFMFWMFIMNIILLTWIGGSPVEYPYDIMGQLFMIYYFMYPFFMSICTYMWDKMIM